MNLRMRLAVVFTGNTDGVRNNLANIDRLVDNPLNLRMDGILDKSGHVPLDGDDLCYQASACAE